MNIRLFEKSFGIEPTIALPVIHICFTFFRKDTNAETSV